MPTIFSNRSPKYQFLLRLTIVYLIQLFIKAFDHSFGGVFPLTIRGASFTIIFTSYWLLCWYFAEFIQKKVATFKTPFEIIVHFLNGFFVGISSNIIYMLGDTYIFNNGHLWVDIRFYNPELVTGLTIFYMLIYIVYRNVDKEMTIKENQINIETIEKEMFKSQYMALKAQIEPHFLFNSLSVLSSLVHTDQKLASDFIIKLSKTLRYIIEQNKRVTVPLEEELKIVEDYFFLLKTRFGDSIQLNINLSDDLLQTTILPPASIQILIENAVKHNKFSIKKPLVIDIISDGNIIQVCSTYDKKELDENSTGMGLSNINKRYQLIANQNITIEKNKTFFIVSLPALSQINHEDFNH
ncbi:sensor histidine kinase [Flammeovirga kamogawensis]|uniref:Histidine kinase n=1 Tax=Flammeovirga kamogawensis TaxID=373891 RepID=A0ABX8H055_9BACT|nr:histidine kinase [Flammeovirga kamogawensis]MBB6459417.1 sensor histidine kinase YesM [Flammeovirga kamogawensis]QWG08972.1 histidine kinase [Flammeovirga kamogawensis]TRX67262.1 hypothetical protein EO216_03560 [Flammeovirga kamogawensis]